MDGIKDLKVAHFYLYDTCNYNCSYCIANQSVDCRKSKFSKVVTQEGMEKIYNFFNERGSWHIIITGGEPSLHPYFVEFVKKLTKKIMCQL